MTRQENGDGAGNVQGSYSYRDAYGLARVVNYVADHNGFRAEIQTNEPGTETSNPAGATILSSSPPVHKK
ncbi:cuticle protein-like protein [Euroglyphus maynei]|uniref:Cuticle protein-like protein n=1 Tax=Euroglyphus maynei TaxID=6958 RepID=A0A1Y3BGI2_EURMA|nr:cuticle protein-like protein [Euroglyphus maynei]